MCSFPASDIMCQYFRQLSSFPDALSTVWDCFTPWQYTVLLVKTVNFVTIFQSGHALWTSFDGLLLHSLTVSWQIDSAIFSSYYVWAYTIVLSIHLSICLSVHNCSKCSHAYMPGRILTKLQHNDHWVVSHPGCSKILGPRSPVGHEGPFCANTQNATPPTDYIVQCWNFVTVVLW